MANSTSLPTASALSQDSDALVCGTDLTGFTRWVDEEVGAHGPRRLEAIAYDLAAFLDAARAILAEDNFSLGCLLGDGLLATRPASNGDHEATKARIRIAIEQLEPRARVGFGEGAIKQWIFTGLPGTRHSIIAGEGVRQCYRALEATPRAHGKRRPPPPVRPSVARFATSQIRPALVGFLAFRANSFPALADFTDNNLAIWQARALASGGRLERLNYDDDALLIGLVWPDAAETAPVEDYLADQASQRPAGVDAGWGAARGPIYSTRLMDARNGAWEDLNVAQGPAINHAAKRAKTMLREGMPARPGGKPATRGAPVPQIGLLGREAERAWIEGRLTAGSRFVLIDGDAGIGKSSILKMAVSSLAGRADVIEVAARPSDVLEPLSLWHSITSAERTAPIDIQFTAVKAQMASRAAHSPLMIAVDDLQWADVYSRRMIDELVRDVKTITILAAGRPGASALVEALDPDDRLSLAGMTETDIHAIARSLGGEDSAAITTLSGGNPFLAVQLTLDSRGGEAALAHPRGQGAIIDLRLGRLAPSSLTALRLFAVLDGDLDAAALGRVCDAAGLTFDPAVLRDLARERFLDPCEAPDSYRFAHRLIQQRVLEQIPPSAMQRISAVTGRLLRCWPDVKPALGVIGQHLRNAGQMARAALADLADAERALAIHAHGPADVLFARAATDFERVGARTDRIALARTGRGLAKWGLGDVSGAFDAASDASRAIASAMPWNTRTRAVVALVAGRRRLLAPRLALALARHAALRSELGYFTGKLADITLGGIVVSRLGDNHAAAQLARTRSLGLLALGLGLLGLKRPARAILARCQRAGGNALPAAYAFCAEALYHLAGGDWHEGERCLAESMDRLGTPPDGHLEGALLCVRALSLHMQGDGDGAYETFEALLRLGRRRQNRQFTTWALYGAAMPLIADGRFAEARLRVEAATELMTGNADLLSSLNCSAIHAQLAWIDGSAARAIDHIETCLDLSRDIFPANFGSLDGFTLPALLLADIVRSGAEADAVQARALTLLPQALRRVRSFASRCAIGNPRLAMVRGMLADSERKRRHHWEDANALSRRMAMPSGLLLPKPEPRPIQVL